MRYLKIFLLYVQDVLQYRSEAIVWFLVGIVNPLLYLSFWRGAVRSSSISGFSSLSEVTGYYLILFILGGLIMTHIEEEVAHWDIKEGRLVRFILKPFPYILNKFFLELTWRILMFTVSLLGILVMILIFGHFLTISITLWQLGALVLMSFLGLMISFIFKMIIGLSALWITEYGGMQQFIFVLTVLFSGTVVPIDMFPSYLKTISSFLPIQYMVYYPVRVLQGKLSADQIVSVISIQILWIALLSFAYKIIWKQGIKRFTGVGI